MLARECCLESCVVQCYHGLGAFNNIEFKRGKNWSGRLRSHETLIPEAFFVILTENSSVVTKDTQGPRD